MPTLPFTQLCKQLNAATKSVRTAVDSGLLKPCGRDQNGREVFELEESLQVWSKTEALRAIQARHYATPQKMRGGRPKKKKTVGEFSGAVEPIHNENNMSENYQSLIELKTKREALRLQKEQLEFEALQKKYVLREDVRKAGAALASIIEDEMDKRPARLSSVLTTMDDELEIFKILAEENNLLKEKIREACGAL